MSAYGMTTLSCHHDVVAPGEKRMLVQVRRAGLAHSGLQHLAQPESSAHHKPKQPLQISCRLGDLAPGPKTLQLSDTIPTVSLMLPIATARMLCNTASVLVCKLLQPEACTRPNVFVTVVFMRASYMISASPTTPGIAFSMIT